MPPRTERPKRASRTKVNYAAMDAGADADDSDADAGFIQPKEDDDDDADDVDDVDDVDVDIPDADLEEDDDDDMEPEEPEDDDIVEDEPSRAASRAKRQSKPPAKVQAQHAKKDVKNSKQITSIKEKFLRFFGNNEQKLIGLIQLRKDWEHSLFRIETDKLESQLELEDIVVPNPVLKSLTKESLEEEFPLKDEPVYFQFGSEGIQEIPRGLSVTNSTTTVLNTGGLITDLTWLKSSTDDQTLVVSISNITDTAISPKHKVLTRNAYNAAFQFYNINTTTRKTTWLKTLLHNWGAAWDLKTVNTDGAIISAVFNDGNVRLIDVSKEGSHFIESASVELTIPGHIISTYDWLSGGTIIVGTDSGHISEFNIKEPHTPSYLYPLHTEYIFSLCVSRSKFDHPVVYSSCSDGTSATFTTNDIVTSINRTPKSKALSKTVVYSPLLYSYVQIEGPYATKAIPVRANFGSTAISKHDGSTESVAVSHLHPFVITGGADGRVKLTNLARKLLNGQKQSAGNHKLLTLFNLQYGAKENQYRYVEDQTVEQLSAVDNISNVNIYPEQISFNSLKWNENGVAGNWIAAGTTSGLLILKEVL